MKVLIAGCGQLGQELGEVLYSDGYEVTGIKRSPTPTLFPMINLDLQSESGLSALPAHFDALIFSVTPDSRDESAYQATYESILNKAIEFAASHAKPPLFIFLSSTGVYGQNKGEWVDEDSPTEPTSYSGKWILYGEEQVKRRLEKPLIIRFSGIYNKHRRWLIDKAMSKSPIQKHPKIWTNRIHQSDCVGILKLALDRHREGYPLQQCYLASDDTPAELYEVVSFIAEKLNRADAVTTASHLSSQQNKRCSNSHIKKLGYEFLYPSFREGYGEILQTQNAV